MDQQVDFIEIYNTYLTSKIRNYERKKNVELDCPFCEAENKFSINVKTGKARCFSCEETCNHISFLAKYHEGWLLETPDEFYQSLSDQRGISVDTFKQAKWAYDAYRDIWLVPYKNPSTQYLSNLGYFRETGDKAFRIWKCTNSSGFFPLTLYNPFFNLTKPNKECEHLIICEGEWDALAMMDLIPKSEKSKFVVVATPGANILPKNLEAHTKAFKSFYLPYDNDQHGKAGSEKMSSCLRSLGNTTYLFDWEGIELPEKTDIRDILNKHKNINFASFEEHLYKDDSEGGLSEEGEMPVIKSAGYLDSIEGVEVIDHIRTYFTKYETHMSLTDVNRTAIIGGLGVATSQYLGGEPLWSFFIGPAACGKTTFIESFGGENELFDYTSKITPKSLISGWNSGSDKSFLQTANNKCLFIKDFTTVLGMGHEAKRELFDILRDAYDGSFRQRFGNSVERQYHSLNFNILAGVTPAIYKHNDADMGERFIRIDYMGNDYDSDSILDCVLGGYGKFNLKKEELTEATLGYVKHIVANRWDLQNNYIDMCKDDKLFIASLSKYVARIRTKPEHDRTDGLKYRPHDEIPARIAAQLQKLAYATEKVIRPKYSPESGVIEMHRITKNVIAKVAFDTAYGFTREILDLIYYNNWMSQSELASKLNIPIVRVQRTLKDMHITKLISSRHASFGKGRNTIQYAPSFAMADILDNAHIEDEESTTELLEKL